ncbi:MAG TPA: hypothetical protein VM933_03840 [Acidimicrobiales bacterium]|nr:hypothetical protein [Acidimicrobiales bacterium]
MPVRPRWRRRLRAWSRSSPVRWWAVVAVLGATTLVVVRSGLVASSGAAARWGPVRAVPVVVAPVAAGDPVPAAAVVVSDRPDRTVPRGDAVATAWAGRTALVPLLAGEVVLTSKLAPAGLRGAAALLPEGARALSVPAGPGGRPPVSIGDTVDLLVTLADTGESVVVAADAVVLFVDREADAVTIAVPADEAPAVASAVATGAVTLALTAR